MYVYQERVRISFHSFKLMFPVIYVHFVCAHHMQLTIPLNQLHTSGVVEEPPQK